MRHELSCLWDILKGYWTHRNEHLPMSLHQVWLNCLRAKRFRCNTAPFGSRWIVAVGMSIVSELLASYRNLCQAGVELVFPPRCTFCSGMLSSSVASKMCEACVESLLGNQQHWCVRCAKPMASAVDSRPVCRRCTDATFPFSEAIVLAAYEGSMREAIIAGKRYINEPLVMSLGRLMGQRILDASLRLPDVVTYVPSHWRRHVVRGTVPAARLAGEVAKMIDRPTARLLRSIRHMNKQATLAAEMRQRNVEGGFAIRRPGVCKNRNVLVVDDVMTTGATLSEVSRVLSCAGAEDVSVAIAARRV